MTKVQSQLGELSRHPELRTTLRWGREHQAAGQRPLQVSGSGAAIVEQKERGELRRFQGQLPPADVDAWGAALVAHRFLDERSSTLPRKPGDTPLLMRLESGDAPVFEVNIWSSDRYEDDDLHAILRHAESLITRVAGIDF